MINSEVTKVLKEYVEFLPVCPETAIGLGIPRESMRLVRDKPTHQLVISKTNTYMTTQMNNYAQAMSRHFKETSIDGFILKSKSPTCGIDRVKLYPSTAKVSPLSKDQAGVFAHHMQTVFSALPFICEHRLNDPASRDYFLTRLFVFHEFKDVKSIQDLIQFHSRHKYLMMQYSPKDLKDLGNCVANHALSAFDEMKKTYEDTLVTLFSEPFTRGRSVNTLMHIFGYFKDALSEEEKAYFLEQLELYKEEKLPLQTVKTILETYTLRFDQTYIKTQSFFNAYPKKLRPML